MTHTIIIETQSDTDFTLFKGLAQRLGLRTEEKHIDSSLSESQEVELLERLAGGWQSEETGDKLVAILQNARQDSPRDVQL